MGDAIRFVVWLLTWLTIRLRYQIRIHGWERIQELKGPVLLLPNHPGFIDPVLILATFYRTFRPRTVLYEGNFPGLIGTFLVKLLRAVRVPELRIISQESHRRAELAITEVIEGLRRGDNFVLWPSGHVQRDGVERLGSARTLTDILREIPDVSLVLVRTSGVWGSMFSFASTGELPRLQQCLWKSVLLLVANLFVFMPRRHVEITVELLDRNALPELKRDLINRWFEERYNFDGSNRPKFVPYHFLFGPRSYEFPPLSHPEESEIVADRIRAETWKTVTAMLAERLGRSITSDELKLETKLDDLGLDSLQRMDLAFEIERRYGVSFNATPVTVGQLLATAEGLVAKQVRKPPPEWFQCPSRVEPLRLLGETIPEAFVARALSTPHNVAAADDFSGVVTYEQLLIGALVMSRRFQRLTALNVGLMLPASVASDMMLLGIYLAGKLPVLLNWTTGPGNLLHAAQLTDLTHVITSRQLRGRLGASVEIPGIAFLDVEDLQQQVGWFEKIYWLLVVRCWPRIVRRLVPHVQPDARAVILFTSGSEKAPKAVPLTHTNVVSNISIIPAILELTNQDALLGFLPMFHSFGFTVTGLLPLLVGIRVVHHSDPTDAAGLIRKIASYLPTVIVGMPSIVDRLFDRAQPADLASVTLIAVGAEACPASLFEKAHNLAPKAVLLEGYGVTECSPMIAANRPKACRKDTIGQPLPGVEVCVVDVQTDQVLPSGKIGMLLVNGPGVFSGYLGNEASPFESRQGKQWYVTGDLVMIDEDGFIHFRGRLKRFIKAGGEMISLPALEEPFTLRFPPNQNGPRVAVEGMETEKGRRIILFTTEPITLPEANACLTDFGFRGVMRVDEVRHLDQIPVLGTGKINYRLLREMISEKTPI